MHSCALIYLKSFSSFPLVLEFIIHKARSNPQPQLSTLFLCSQNSICNNLSSLLLYTTVFFALELLSSMFPLPKYLSLPHREHGGLAPLHPFGLRSQHSISSGPFTPSPGGVNPITSFMSFKALMTILNYHSNDIFSLSQVKLQVAQRRLPCIYAQGQQKLLSQYRHSINNY